jgi:hypothetical protein
MVEEFSKRMAANGRMTFGLGRTKKLTGLMHWIQDCFHMADNPNHTVFDEQALAKLQSHAHICKSNLDLVDMNSKAADPGKLSGPNGVRPSSTISLLSQALMGSLWHMWFTMMTNRMTRWNTSTSMSA